MDTTTAIELAPNTEVTKELKKYTGVAGRILNMLCSGLSPKETADAIGVDVSLIAHLKEEPDFIEQIKIRLIENTERAIQIDDNYAYIEKQATDRLKSLIGLIHSPKDLMQLAAFANQAKKKTSSTANVDSPNGNEQKSVKILMPMVVLNNFSMNPNNEIVEAGGRTLTTLNSASINSLVAKAEQQQIVDAQIEASKPALLPNSVSPKPTRSSNHVSAEDLDKL